MSLTDILVNAIVSYKGDTSDLKQQVKDLQGVQRDMAQQELDNANARNKQLQDWADQLESVTGVLGKLKAAGDFVWDGMKLKQQELRLETASYGVDIDRLAQSFGGLKTNMEVLQFAAHANQSEFKLTNDQLNMVAQATRTLTERGFDAAQVQDAFTNAVVTGRVKGLLPYGFQLGDTSGAIDLLTDKLTPLEKAQQRVNDVMGFAGTLAKDAGTGVGTFGEDADRAATNLKNAWTSMKESLGGLADQLVPLVEHLAKAAQLIGDIASLADKLPGGGASKPQADRDWTDTAASLGKSLFNPSDLLDVYGDARSAVTGNDGSPKGNGAFLAGQIRDAKIKSDQARAIVMQQLADGEKNFLESFTQSGKGLGESFTSTGLFLADEAKKQTDEMRRQAIEKAKQLAEEIKKMTAKQLDEAGAAILAGEGSADAGTYRIALAASPGIRTQDLNTNYQQYNNNAPQTSIVGSATAAALATIAAINSDPAMVSRLTSDNPAARSGLGLSMQNIGAHSAGDPSLGAAATPGLSSSLLNIDAPYFNTLQQIPVDDRNNVLTKMFGPLTGFDAYKKAFEGLTSAVTAGLNAWISGSESAGTAIKKALGSAVEAVADQLAVEGLKNAAFGIGQLALFLSTGDPKAAAAATTYAEAAAMDLAGAAVAASVAREMGAGASTASSSRGGGASAGAAAATNPASTAPNNAANGGTTIVYGDAFAADSPRMRAVKAKKLVALATGTTSGTVSS